MLIELKHIIGLWTAAGMRNFDVNHDGLDCCFGILTGYPCCTSNMHQGWSKFTQNLWYATPTNGVAATQYAPSEVRMKVGDGIGVHIVEQMNYPFGETVAFRIKELAHKVRFPFTIRIPYWSEDTEIRFNGETIAFSVGEDRLATIEREWSEGDEIVLLFSPHVRLTI